VGVKHAQPTTSMRQAAIKGVKKGLRVLPVFISVIHSLVLVCLEKGMMHLP
jgi:hypothetical protein